MNNFDLFRKKMSNEAACRQKFETRFITEGASSITIHILRLDEDRAATMVFNDTEGPDSAIVFTPKQDNSENNLNKSDYYAWDNKYFFVYEDVLIARETTYIKQKAYQCNVEVELENGMRHRGYFISSLRSYQDTELQQKINITDKEHPILIIPYNNWIEVGIKVSIGSKPWKVIDYDYITNSGIAYISLERDFYFKSEDIYENIDRFMLKAGIDYEFETSDGYFHSSSPLNIKTKTENKVIFEIPYGLKQVNIEVKKNGKVQSQTYNVEV